MSAVVFIVHHCYGNRTTIQNEINIDQQMALSICFVTLLLLLLFFFLSLYFFFFGEMSKQD